MKKYTRDVKMYIGQMNFIFLRNLVKKQKKNKKKLIENGHDHLVIMKRGLG